MGYLFSSHSSVGFYRAPLQTLDPIAIALGYMAKTYGKTLLLKTPHTRVIGLGENKLVLILKLFSTG